MQYIFNYIVRLFSTNVFQLFKDNDKICSVADFFSNFQQIFAVALFFCYFHQIFAVVFVIITIKYTKVTIHPEAHKPGTN
jgi:uncharacterized membrane protein YagU involved in acid resistance